MDDEHPIRNALIKAGLVLSLLALVTGFLGWLHPMGDLLAVGRAYAAAATALFAVFAIMSGQRLAAFGSLLLALIVGVQIALVYLWPGPLGPFVLYQKNLLYRNADLAGVEADIRTVAPLAVTLQEVSDQNLSLLAALKDQFPYQLHCPWRAVGGTAVATSLTPIPGGEICAPGLAALQVEWNDRQVWIVSIHLHWPWPHKQADHVRDLLPVLKGLEGPVAMAGDFNMVRWGTSVDALAHSARVNAAGPSRGTYLGFAPLLWLPIDHAFAPHGGRLEYRDALGSDHRGVVAHLEL
jgi:endonuclease/exonuclease/phosphatase (EEP) superfamily protein YafD